jgi:polyribonucleotide nucleotidyltransferase
VEYFEIICNAIVFISAVLIAVKNIAEMCGKPIKFIKKKNDRDLETKITTIVTKLLPDMLKEYDEANKTAHVNDVKTAVIKQIGGQLNSVDTLANQYKALEISAKDVLREKIVCMYESNKDQRRLRHFERRALDQYYKDYKAMNGNSYIDIIYNRMKAWEVEPDDYE